MDLNDVWQNHRRFILGVGAGLLVLVVGFALVLLGAFAALVFFGAGADFAAARLGFASGSAAAGGAVSTFGGAGGSAISAVALLTVAAELGAGALGAMGAEGAGRGAVESKSCWGPWCAIPSRSRHRSTIPRSTAASVSCTPVCFTCACCRRRYSWKPAS